MENSNTDKKKLVLDYSTWRCGGEATQENRLGEGATQLLNKEGFMCCLGQFSIQLSEEVAKNPQCILEWGEPHELGTNILSLTRSYEDEDEDMEGNIKTVTVYNDTMLSTEAIDINDNPETTPEEKIILLKELFGKHGYEIEVINQPVKV